MTKVLLTGATGFVGSALLDLLQNIPEYRILSAVRSDVDMGLPKIDTVVVGNIKFST